MKQGTQSVRKRPERPDPLTEKDWRKVFDLRCRSKRGERMFPEDGVLTKAAWKENPKRYGEMKRDVFNATVPAGSTVRWPSGTKSKKKARR